jgi:hypothetical protein
MMCLFADLLLCRGVTADAHLNPQVHTNFIARPDLATVVRANFQTFALYIAIATATPWPRSCRGVANLSLRASFKV